ncbi:MAG TPA: hypothetical protein VHY75_17040 [Steroidobacteraceae bacterium]|jgi:hypothetical protein|nr:hypothetical protein [Steroidobacteraceae bacterium]
MTGDHRELRSWLAAVRLLRLGAVAMFVLGTSALMLISTPARAVPPFARQTGLACEACHTIPPELTSFGRRFKLNGYTLTTRPPLVQDIDEHKKNTVWLTDLPGIGILLQATYNHYDRTPPDSAVPGAKAQNDNLQFPQQWSIIGAGAITDHVGGFLQMTYDQPGGTFSVDNTEIRYSDHTQNNDWVWGVLFNNNPGNQDVWNSVAAYPIPDFSSQSLWSAGIDGAGLSSPFFQGLGALVAGPTAYVWYKDSLYLGLSAYHAAKSGSGNNTLDSSNLSVGGGTVEGWAPYWRAAYERDWGYHSASVGVSGMYTKFTPSVVAGQTLNPGYINRYLDISYDWQYQYNGQHNIFSFLGRYTHENQENDPGLVSNFFNNPTDRLNEWNVTGEYYYDRHYGGLINFVRTTGTPDGTVYGGNGSPGHQYEVLELDYLPWFNFRFILQYNIYQVVRNNQNPFILLQATNPKASDNNTWVLGLWMDL